MAITFQVNLQTVKEISSRNPYTSDLSTAFSNSRSTWFPDVVLGNRKLEHGDTFEVSGPNAVYLRTNFTSGDFKFLDVVSGTA